ncbi:MAG: quinone-dependent dihydroorotate dehydrogenase [Fimbriimonadaceae bacterium]
MSATFYEKLLKPLLFRMDAEKAHNLAMSAIKRGWAKGETFADLSLEQEIFGVKFPNPVGLAAGFDKDGVAIKKWKDFGFGFIEIGTVTRHAQPGNPKPRLFRLIDQQAIINRMGFNNAGADALLRQLDKAQAGIPLGINIGKSKVTPLEQAADDYGYSFKLLREHGDYFVVNVSSPNTEGLRTLQDRDSLTKIIWRLKEIDQEKPLFVKISPDLSEEALDEIIEVAHDFGLTGLIATNTTIERSMLKTDPNQAGGLSGTPVKNQSVATLSYLKKKVNSELKLIGVGGIMTPSDAHERLELGADLVQIYSGWIYNGTSFPADICRHIAKLRSTKALK